VDFSRTVEVIELASPDLVFVEEAWGQIPRLARELRWPEYDVRRHVLSTLPLLDGEDVLFVETSPGCALALENVHLPSDPPIEDVLREAGVERAIDVERATRLPALEPALSSLRPLVGAGMPVVLAGDFNTTSHLDDGLGWPTSRALAEAGLRDAWREVHPDPTTHPGFTWWAARPKVEGWNPSPDSPQSRIDRLYTGGPIRVKSARLVGEAGRKGVDLGGTPWPSDHRALLVEIEATPAATPTRIAAWPPLAAPGQEIRVRARGFPAGSRVALFSSSREATLADLPFATSDLEPGAYEVLLLDASGTPISRSQVLLHPAGRPPQLELAEPRPPAGAPIVVRFSGAPGNRWDWVGIYPEGSDPDLSQPLLWRHTGARVQGESSLDATAEGDGWPLPPGAYRVYLCEDDSYRPLASVPVNVERR
jgi:hypothetical protein